MQVRDIPIGKRRATGVEIPLAGGTLLLIAGRRGTIGSELLDLSAAEAQGAAGAVVRGAKDVQALLDGEIWSANAAARDRGVKPGMTGLEALKKFL